MAQQYRGPESTTNWQLITGVLAVIFLALALVALLAVLGGGPADESPTPGASMSASASPSPPTGSGEPTSALPSEASSEPSPGASTEPSPAASAVPSPSSAISPSPGASPDATACSGSDDNRAFFTAAAEALTFEVYCAVLPSGWSVVSGSYRGSGGGRLEIAYRGPGGATLQLREGPAACTDVPACPPTGGDLGAAAFGDRPGELLATDNGVAVDASDGALYYIAETTGLDQATATALAAALIPIR